MRRFAILSLAVAVSAGFVWADQTTDNEMKKDVVLRALVDELVRGKTGLMLEDLERPYFIEYALSDTRRGFFDAELGAVTNRDVNHSRRLRSDVRVGSYKLDNTNYEDRFRGFFGGGFSFFGGAPIPIEDDYDAIRQAIWWSTDRRYKEVIETFEKKKAFMEGKVIEDKPDDFSREKPSVHFAPRSSLPIEDRVLEELAVNLSGLFREYPDVKKSGVSIQAGAWNRYLLNTEGTRLRTAGTSYSVIINATVQAEDGMELSDSLSFHARDFDGLPPRNEMTRRCRDMVTQLLAVKDAPKLESYTGPVLFEPPAAASVFSKRLAHRFSGGQRALGSRRQPDDLANKLHKRILPRFVDVVDDPTRKTITDKPVMGHYRFDSQGVAARPVKLVEDGKLEALLMSRNPSKDFKQSTGHGRGSRRVRSSYGALVMTAESGANEAALKQELLEACEDEDLEFAVKVASVGSAGALDPFGRFRFMDFDFGGFGGPRATATMPLVMYKVYPDGREELVRGAEFAEISPKAFKRVLAAGTQLHVINQGGIDGKTVAAPALLFEELDLAKIDRDFDKPPILPPPLAR